jgi:ATP-dependent helicase/nuclease subunit A
VILPDTTSRPGGLGRHEGLLHTPGGPVFPLARTDAPRIVADAKAAADADILSEHRRLLYVALTRARDRLFICGFTGKRGAGENSWYGWMKQAAEDLGVESAQAGMTYRAIGMLAEDIAAAAPTVEPVEAQPGWIARPAPAEPAVPNPIRPSEIGAAPATASPLGAGAGRFRRGTVVHALLARLPEVARERRRDIALRFAAAQGYCDAAGEELVREILAVLDHPEFAPIFGPMSRAEATIHAMRPDLGLKAPITGRIDRLAVTPDAVLILDFKTNRPAPHRLEDIAPTYLDQMALYRAAAQAVFPGRRIVCGLVFTDGPRLICLPDALLRGRISGMAARLSSAP